MSRFRNRLMATYEDRGIPYKRVSFLRSTGTQYIDTGILVTYDRLQEGMVLEIKMAANNNAASGKNNAPYFFVGRSISLAYYGFGSSWERSSITFENDTPYVLKLDSVEGKFYVNGNVAAQKSLTTRTASGNNIALFGVYNNSAMGYKYAQTIYWCKIRYKGELVRDMVPVEVDGVGYMYDKVSGELFGNLGTGSFILVGGKYLIISTLRLSAERRAA